MAYCTKPVLNFAHLIYSFILIHSIMTAVTCIKVAVSARVIFIILVHLCHRILWAAHATL